MLDRASRGCGEAGMGDISEDDCNALGRSRLVRARLQDAVTSTKSKKCKHMSLVILIC